MPDDPEYYRAIERMYWMIRRRKIMEETKEIAKENIEEEYQEMEASLEFQKRLNKINTTCEFLELIKGKE